MLQSIDHPAIVEDPPVEHRFETLMDDRQLRPGFIDTLLSSPSMAKGLLVSHYSHSIAFIFEFELAGNIRFNHDAVLL